MKIGIQSILDAQAPNLGKILGQRPVTCGSTHICKKKSNAVKKNSHQSTVSVGGGQTGHFESFGGRP